MPDRQFIFTLLTTLVFLATNAHFLSAADTAPKTQGPAVIQWRSHDAGIKAIKEGKKKGYMHFYTDWCHFCKVMSANTFTDPKVIAYLNDHFIPILVNGETDKQVARAYGVDRYPNNWFLSENGDGLSHQPGYIPPDMFLEMLRFLHTDSYKTMKFSDFINQKSALGKNTP